MNLQNIRTVTRYEARLLRRSWLFRIFGVLAFIGIFCAVIYRCTPLIIDGVSRWGRVALSDQIPFFSLYLYNILQSVILIFFVGGMSAKERKMDTMDVIYARPIGNGEYLLGKVLGIAKVCGGMLIAVLVMTLLLHLTVAQSPFSIVPYVWYSLTLVLPSFVFVLGMAMLANYTLKNRSLTLIVVLGVLGILFFYLNGTAYGVGDLFGQYVPAVGSDVTGMANLRIYLLQRGAFLVAGIGFVLLSVAAFKRLPNRNGKAGVQAAGGMFLIATIAISSVYILHFREEEAQTARYGEIYNHYASVPQIHVAKQDLDITLGNKRLQGTSQMILVNTTKQDMKQIVLYLNPELRIENLTSGAKKLSFERKGQVMLVKQPLQAKDSLQLTIQYSGTIDETVCYTDVPLTERRQMPKHKGTFNFGKRYAWLEKEFTQLTPECLWYPTGTAAAHPASPFDIQKDFTRYDLTVHHAKEQTILSQGETERGNGITHFINHTPLSGISLTAGDYERMGIEVDSTLYEVYCFRGHNYFSESLDTLREAIKEIIPEYKTNFCYSYMREYPFEKFILAETPAPYYTYIRNQKGYTEFVMPEIMFLPERGYNLLRADFAHEIRNELMMTPPEFRNSFLKTRQALFHFLNEILGGTNERWKTETTLRELSSMIIQHSSFIQSEKYPIMDAILQKAQVDDKSISVPLGDKGIDYKQRAKWYLQKHSLQDAIQDPNLDINLLYAIIQLKSDELLQRIQMKITKQKYQSFVENFFQEHVFESVPFNTFCKELNQIDSIDIKSMLPEWYNNKGCASVFIQDGQIKKIIGQEKELWQVSFKAYNPSKYDAVLSTRLITHITIMYKGRSTLSGMLDSDSWLLPAGKAFEYKFVSENKPANLDVNTNISHNMPSGYSFSFSDATLFKETRDTASGAFPIGIEAFQPNPNEIIVDNESAGFKIKENQKQHKLKDLFKKEKEDEYTNFQYWATPVEWSAFLADYCHGDIIRSAMYKQKGIGQATATWTANLPAEGYYEIFIWNARNKYVQGTVTIDADGTQRVAPKREQSYIVRYGKEEETIVVEVDSEPNDWVSLGQFYLPTGETSITLTDETNGSYVIADAVKFTRIE